MEKEVRYLIALIHPFQRAVLIIDTWMSLIFLIALMIQRGMCCNVCNLPLWRKGDGAATNAAGGYGRKTCMTTDQKTGKEIEIHVACSDRCLYSD